MKLPRNSAIIHHSVLQFVCAQDGLNWLPDRVEIN